MFFPMHGYNTKEYQPHVGVLSGYSDTFYLIFLSQFENFSIVKPGYDEGYQLDNYTSYQKELETNGYYANGLVRYGLFCWMCQKPFPETQEYVVCNIEDDGFISEKIVCMSCVNKSLQSIRDIKIKIWQQLFAAPEYLKRQETI